MNNKITKYRVNQDRPSELTTILDHFTTESAGLLWEIATNPEHEWHRKYGFEALKTLFNKVTPVRKEPSEPPSVNVNLANMFSEHSLDSVEVKEIEVDTEGLDEDPEDEDGEGSE